jgi:hypothetical protein
MDNGKNFQVKFIHKSVTALRRNDSVAEAKERRIHAALRLILLRRQRKTLEPESFRETRAAKARLFPI